MKQRIFLIVTVAIFSLLIYHTVSAQSATQRLEKGSLIWEKTDFCYSVTYQDGSVLEKGDFVGALADYNPTGMGEFRFSIDDNGLLDGPFTIDVEKGKEIIEGTYKKGCYDGKVTHFRNGEKVSEVDIENQRLRKTIDYAKDGEIIALYEYDGDRYSVDMTYPNGSRRIVTGTDNEHEVTKFYNVEGQILEYINDIDNEHKKWNTKGQLTFHSYEEIVDAHFNNRVEATYENGIISKKYSTMVSTDKLTKGGYKEKTYTYYYANGKIKEEHISKPTLEQTGKDFRIARKFDKNGNLKQQTATHFDKTKGVEIDTIIYYENGKVVGKDRFEVATIAPPKDE